VETWDTLGMRATSSHDVALDNVYVSEAQVVARRPWGRVDPALRNAAIHFAPPVAAVYFGVAASARDESVRVACQRKSGDGRPLVEDPSIQRQVGQMEVKLRTSWWSLLGALDELGDDYALDDRAVAPLMAAKRHIVTEAISIVDLAMDVVGGASYFKRSSLERAYRDVRAGAYHPFTPEKTLLYAGRLALDQSVETIW
jgi:acyl-CoA dehydrogenase